MKVLIGYDGSEYSDAIIQDLRNAGLPDVLEARIISVADTLTDGPPTPEFDLQSLASRRVEMVLRQAREHAARVIEETKEIAASEVERLGSIFPRWDVTMEVRTGTPQWELLEAADEWGADLIVVGSRGSSAVGRFFLGSVSKRVATDARSSVRVVRPGRQKEDETAPRIVIGVDGSPAAERAIHEVGQRAWPSGTEVRLVAVDDEISPVRIAMRLPQATKMINEYILERTSRVAAMLEWAESEFAEIGLKSSVARVSGNAEKVLLDEADIWNADQIFVGTRDLKGAFERLRLGSVSTAIVTNAHCSVEIVRPAASREDVPLT